MIRRMRVARWIWLMLAALFAAGPGAALAADPLTLGECIARALKFAPNVEFAAAGAELGGAQVRETRAALMPVLRSEGEYAQWPGYNERITNRGMTRTQLISDYLIFDGGRRLAQLRASRYRAESATLGFEAARLQITFDTEVAFFDLLRARQAEGELAQSRSRIGRFATIITALNRSGRVTANDALKINVAANQAELDVSRARQDRQRASVVLGSLIGEFGNEDLAITNADISFPSATELNANPVLQAARREHIAATADIQAARAERTPNLKVELTAGYLGIDPQNTFEHRGGASYDTTLVFPLFDGGVIRAHVDEAKAREHQASAAERQTELELKRNYAEAALKYREARHAIDVLETSRGAADDAFELTWARFLGGGNITLLEVLDAYQQAERVRLDRLDQEFAAREAAATAARLVASQR